MQALPSDLVPPDALIIDGSGNSANFAAAKPSLLWNVLIPRCGMHPDAAILDIGSGNGRHARVLSQYLSPKGRYVGFDIVRPAVEWCQRAYERFPNFRFDLAELHSSWYAPEIKTTAADYIFPYEREGFDVAFATSLFTHLAPAETANYLSQTARVLRPGGKFAFSAFLWREDAPQRDDIQGARFQRISETHHTLDFARPSRGIAHDEQNMRAMIKDAGLVLAEMQFGKWAHPIDHVGNFQDLMILVKP